jgi:hypothetical protein
VTERGYDDVVALGIVLPGRSGYEIVKRIWMRVRIRMRVRVRTREWDAGTPC